MKRLLAATGLVALGVLLAVGAFVTFSTDVRPDDTKLLKGRSGRVTWSPDHLVVTMAPGDTRTIDVTVFASGTIPATEAVVVPALAPYLAVTPPTLPSFGADLERTITLSFAIPNNAPFQMIDGTIHLRPGATTIARPLPIRLAIGLPPDPGDAGRATLEGIDSDGDGLRDDLQRYIFLTYPDSPRTRAALRQYILTAQSSIIQADDREASVQNALARLRALDCLTYVRPQDYRRVRTELRAEILNTEERSRAWASADAKLGGREFDLPSDLTTSCDFDPN